MSFELGKKLVVWSIIVGIIISFIFTGIILGIALSSGANPRLITILAGIVTAIPTIICAGGFAMMWYTGGNFMHLVIGGLRAIAIITAFISSPSPVVTILMTVIGSLWLLAWAYRYMSVDMGMTVKLGALFGFELLASILTVIAPALSSGFLFTLITLMVAIASIVFTVQAAKAEVED